MAEQRAKKATKDEALEALLEAHSRRENRNIDGSGHQYYIYDKCPLCTSAKEALGIDEDEFEVHADSSPAVRITDKHEPPKLKNTARTPRAAEGDETPAGYLGYDGPDSSSTRDEAKTATLDNQAKAKPLDPKMAGPDAQRKEQARKAPPEPPERKAEREAQARQTARDAQAQRPWTDQHAELSPEEIARRKAQR